MSAGVILPVAKSLYLCDGHLGFTSGKTDLMGNNPFRVDIRLAASGQFVAGSSVQQLVFSDRDTIVNMVVTLKGISFPQPGIFLVELLLDNQWVADTTVELK